MAGWRAIPDTIARRFLNQRHNPWTKDAPISREQALLEAALLQILDDQTYSERDLADKWHRSRRFVRAALEDARNEMENAGVPGMSDPKSTSKSTGKSTTHSQQNQHDTEAEDTKKIPKGDQKDTKKHDRARDLSVEETIRDDTTPPQSPPRFPDSTDAGRGIGDRGRDSERSAPGTREEPSWRPPPHDDRDAPPATGGKPTPAPVSPRPPSPNWGSPAREQGRAGTSVPAEEADRDKLRAVSSRLTEVWHEETAKMPTELRGRSPGWTPPWDLDLLEAGAEDAEEAIRALAELCRGTATRAPKVFEWSALMGSGSRLLAGCWRDALAWKRGVGGEPAIGRAWRGGDGRADVSGGAGQGGGKAKRGTGKAVIIGQGKHDPYDDGWGNAAPGEREAAEKAFAERTARKEAERAARAGGNSGGSS